MLKTRDFSFLSEEFIQIYLDKDLKGEGSKYVLQRIGCNWLENLPVRSMSSCCVYPYLYSCWSQTLDGQLTLRDNKKGRAVANALRGEKTSALLDFWWLNLARSLADGVIIGAQTLREEPYLSAHIWDRHLLSVRTGFFEEQPLQIIVSLSGNLAKHTYLLTQETLSVLLYTNRIGLLRLIDTLKRPWKLFNPLHSFSLHGQVSIFLEEDFGSLKDFLAYITQLGIRRLLIESPFMTHELLKQELLQEMWISTAGLYSGEKTTLDKDGFFSSKTPQAKLMSLYLSQGRYLYARYEILKDV